MATKVIGPYGGVYDVGNTANTYQLATMPMGDKRISILNKGAAVVYLEWFQADAEANTNEKDGKLYLESQDSAIVPPGVTSFAAKTASGSAKLLIQLTGA